MQQYIYISLFLSLTYVFIILRYFINWKSIPVWEIPPNFSPQTKVTIIIPARNESAYIQTCIQSILDQKYPTQLFEILVIDDHSEDNTTELVRQFQAPNTHVLLLNKFISNRKELQSFKKKAIEIGVKNSKGDLIISTDADCIVPPNWLHYLVSFYEKEQYKFIAAPVNFHKEISLFEKFQSLDFIGMMGVTGAGIYGRFMNMCNGANLAYEKRAFYAVEGFNGIDKIASGDDMLLLQKMAKHFPNQVGFLKNKNATVLTNAKPDLKSFYQQRIRWASKSGNYQELQILFILALVFFFCLSIVFNLILLPFFFTKIGWVFLTQLFIKTIIDFFYLNHLTSFFQRKDLMKIFFPAQVFHILYIFVFGLLGNLVKEYSWKGRKVK